MCKWQTAHLNCFACIVQEEKGDFFLFFRLFAASRTPAFFPDSLEDSELWPRHETKRVSNFFEMSECHITLLFLTCSPHRGSDKETPFWKWRGRHTFLRAVTETKTPISSQQRSDMSTLTGKVIKYGDHISGVSHKCFVSTLKRLLTTNRTTNRGRGHFSSGSEMMFSGRHTGSLSWCWKLTFHRQQHLPFLWAWKSLSLPLSAGWIGFQDSRLSWDWPNPGNRGLSWEITGAYIQNGNFLLP